MFRTHFSQNIKSWPFPPRSSVSQRLCLFTCACALKPTNGRDYNEEMMMMMMTPPDMSNPIRTATETQHLGTFSFRFGLGCQWPVEIYGFSTHDDDMVQLDGVLPVSNSQPASQDMERRRENRDWFKLCVHCFHLEIISRDRGRETRLVKSSQWLRWIITP